MKKINEIAIEISRLNSTEIEKLSQELLNYNINATIYHFGIVPTIETFKVHMVSAGQRKLAIVKLTKEYFNIGLREAKDIVDNVPSLLGENLTYNEVKNMKRDFEDLGATISIND